MKDFQLHIPTKLFFGSSNGALFAQNVAQETTSLLVVTGGSSVERYGYLDACCTLLKEAGCSLEYFSGVEPNPDAETINKAARLGREKGVEGIIAIGGGSAMDAAKAISALIASDEEDIWPFVSGQTRCGQLKAALPIFMVPTTAATASEVTPFAVISSRATQGKAPIAYEFIKSSASWLNPEFTLELPRQITQDGAADILSHVFENYILGGSCSLLTDRYCESIILTVLETLPECLRDPSNEQARGTLLWCSTLALNGMQMAGRSVSTFPLHAIEHAMSAQIPELAHGRGLATLFPAYFKWLWQAGRARERFTRLGVELFSLPAEKEDTGLLFIESFQNWLAENELLQSSTSLGLSREQFPKIARRAVDTSGSDGVLEVLGELNEENICEILELTQQQ